ncbi:MAG: nickel-dependent hydrogenase large subunit, partial [Bauldia sp.]
MTVRLIGPFNRVEGDLEVKIDIADGAVRAAWVNSPLYRGFERILGGKDPRDALVYAPRICGICSISQSVAAARALADAQGLAPPPNGRLATDLVLAAENTADHLTHFYLFFMPDFCRATYAAEPWHATAAERFAAMSGSAAREVLVARAEFMHLFGILAGKWPHSLAIQPGGSSRAIERQEQMRLLAILASFRRFLEHTLFAAPLEEVAELDSAAALDAWIDDGATAEGDFRHFLVIARALALDRIGRAADRFMSYGSFGMLASGLAEGGAVLPLDLDAVSEDLSHSWFTPTDGPQHPFNGRTVPDADQPNGYSWCKAPRLGGAVVEVGAFARQTVAGHPLAVDLARSAGANVRSRVVGRLLEIARLVIAMEGWARELTPRERFCEAAPVPDEATGVGLVEAARGSLGHWLRIRNGRILNYQIVAPTTWNFSPRDAGGTPGALEQALAGAPVRDGETDLVSVQHIVRSFDPCMVCTVH